ncbi:hypothetical protein A9G35_11570 [Gilliamella sp. Choc5-1]|jgi:hypothetical protein|uniref:hypothetical protein n=1 Tax=Gilliamella sp. Choc5-1 TaxID=3120238 RepID=UPI00080E67BF|nr:hypothetical protein [Gilliamella apicola]OCG49556.1 hypothetical protein A9G35_11570 [Gilliamella apicola]
MNIHKKTKLTPYHRQEICHLYHKEKITVTELAKRFMTSRLTTIYSVLKKVRLNLFAPLICKGKRYKSIGYGIKHLAKVKNSIEDKLRQQAN